MMVFAKWLLMKMWKRLWVVVERRVNRTWEVGGCLFVVCRQRQTDRDNPLQGFLSPQSCEFTHVRDKGLGMGGSFSLVLNSSCPAAVQLGQRESTALVKVIISTKFHRCFRLGSW
jgi:hypothetical protein